MWKNRTLYALIDAAAIVISYLLAMLVRFGTIQGGAWIGGPLIPLAFVVLMYFLVAFFYQPSTEFLKRSGLEELKVVLIRLVYMLMLISVAIYGFRMGEYISRLFVALFLVIQRPADVSVPDDFKKRAADPLSEA